MGLQPLNEVRKALSGAWDLTRAGFWWRTAESAAVDRDWGVAATRLLRLADALEHVEHGAPAWRQLLIAALDASVRAHSGELVEATCAQVLGRAYSGSSDTSELRSVFAVADAEGQHALGAQLGQTIRQRVPTSPWGHYAVGHFQELRHLHGGNVRPTKVVRAFERAATLFGAETDYGRHSRLRAAVAQIAHTNEGEAGRAALREVAQNADKRDLGWLAYGRTFSSFWLDRVRAADWVVDELDARGHGDEVRGTAAASVAFELCRNLPAELTDAEDDRLRHTAEGLGPIGPAVRSQVEMRAELSDSLGQTLDAFSEASFTASGFAELSGLLDAWHGRVPARPLEGLPGCVVSVMLADEGDREDALTELAAAVRELRGDALKPVVLVLSKLARGDESDALEEIAIHYAWRATAPSCGFLLLAHRVYAAGLPRAAAALTRRGIESGEDSAIREVCVARAIRWASEHASDSELLRWLDTGEQLLG